ncbi:BTAD domain-containing putative transcriptional regulator [Ilumatobacter sp.]|uniref:BTAD domain-containing putative transcriptional regulator n=1 Tax=Ilumatobacter sp. TaxID=1967498 RepID=UPI003AF8757D
MIVRDRVESPLTASDAPRLISLIAGAGSGKTTLISSVSEPQRWVVHAVSSADRSVSAFARNVVRRLRLLVPGLSAELWMAIEGASGAAAGSDGVAESLAAAIALDLDAALSRDLVLVLDDLHEIDGSGPSERFVADLCRHAPARLRIVLASRSTLPFPTARLRLTNDHLELDADDLAFTVEEITELLADEGASGAAAEIHELTGGWPAAVALAARAIRRGGVAGLRRGMADEGLADYLADDVLRSESDDSVALLEAGAHLPWLSQRLVDDLLPELSGAATRLLGGVSASAFVNRIPDDPEAVTIAPVLREYLRSRSSAHAEVLVPATDWYRQLGDWSSAVACLLDGADSARVRTFIAQHGERMTEGGLIRELAKLLDAIRDEPFDADLTLLDAHVRELVGDLESAERLYLTIGGGDGPLDARVALRLGYLQYVRGDLSTALATFGRAIETDARPETVAALRSWEASAHYMRGDSDAARSVAEAARRLAEEADDPRSSATVHTVLAMIAALDGDRSTNDVHYLRALEYAERAGDVMQLIRIRSNRSSHFLEEGDLDAALAELDIALRLADMSGYDVWRAMALTNRGECLLLQGSLDESARELVQAEQTFRRIGSAHEKYTQMVLGDVHATRGDRVLARVAYERAIELAEVHADAQALVHVCASLSAMVADVDPELVATLTERVDGLASPAGQSRVWLAHARVDLARGDRTAAFDAAHEAATEARRRNLRAVAAEALEVRAAAAPDTTTAMRALDEGREVWKAIGSPIGTARVDVARAELLDGASAAALASAAAERLDQLGAKGLAIQARRAFDRATERASVDVVVRTLGGFEVDVADEPVPVSAWQSRVARELLGVLVASRGRPLNREQLVEQFWPDDDSTKAANRLSVALSTIRGVLDPERSRPADHYLRADRNSVALSDEHLSIDVFDFLDQAAEGSRLVSAGDREHGLALLRSAERLYIGEFLPEEPYADWAFTLREEARASYLTIAGLLAEDDAASGDHESAARRYLRMLERDEYEERAHLGVVSAMSALQRHGTARRLYATYATRMAEIGIEPATFPS